MRTKTLIILLFIIIIFTFISAYLIKKTQDKDDKPQENSKTTEPNIDTSHWEIYKDEEFGFEIKYPKDWKIFKLPDANAGYVLRSSNFIPIKFGTEILSSGEIYLSIISNPYEMEILELIKTFDDTSSFWPDMATYETMRINENNGVLFPEIDENKIFSKIRKKSLYKKKVYFIKSKKKIYSFQYIYANSDKNFEKIFDQVVYSTNLII